MPMKPLLLIAASVALAGCVLPDDFPGSVSAVNERTVTITGAYSMDGSLAHPTPRMIEQAREICPGAKYLSATPTQGSLDTFDFLFLCN